MHVIYKSKMGITTREVDDEGIRFEKTYVIFTDTRTKEEHRVHWWHILFIR